MTARAGDQPTAAPALAMATPNRSIGGAWRPTVAVAAGGGVGAVARYGLASALPASAGRFPWGTFVINVSGAAVLGLLLVLVTELLPRDHLARPFACTGIIGAYTTFSTYMVDAAVLIRDHHVGTALSYLSSSLAAGLLAVWLGVLAARALARRRGDLGPELDVLSRDPEVR